MKVSDVIQQAARNISRGGIKTFLCALALCVGICSVCTVATLGSAVSGTVIDEVNRLGVGGMTIYSSSRSYTVSDRDIEAASASAGVSAVMPLAIRQGSVRLKSDSYNSMILGVNERLPDIFNIELLHGRLLTQRDVDSSSNVAIIDDDLAMSTYQRTNVIGKTIQIYVENYGEDFTIIGVIKSQKSGLNALFSGGIPNLVYAPYTAVNTLVGENTTEMLAISCIAENDSNTIASSVTQKLAKLNSLGFKYENLDYYAGSFKTIASLITLLASGVAGISIFVGGIGVMNSLIASVESRTREIGIYMALGARRIDILKGFLTESQLLCFIGGSIGIIISLLITFLIMNRFNMPFLLPIKTIMYGVLGILLCGTVFGILPASRAAKLNPIDAIRIE